jgi:hypothetical protein
MLGGWLVERQGGSDFDRSLSADIRQRETSRVKI